ncbi:bifunctional diaminohydroxyphosphoribosylaminopyrimidine deaminase/5-amino-6-(5-phosphoribosylamino)uracil reductase RibD [Thermodesulfovibrionales bacterium]|nr:bifunctional diaminohydroxyphosphoribosylaminopyrimidine deaminase/5-amino-6-(5-phosphoribosylamino)uracil reductase RibD [Thermodesulfovibrionales bacterium]
MEGLRILTNNHELFMKEALRLAAKARGMTSPNPMVGAVIVKDGIIIAKDYHRRVGELHAEASVISKAGKNTKGSILYVTLEPCCHKDKRTSPCTEAIIKAEIKSVVIAMEDPNPKVSGRGIKILRRQGIEVSSGILEDKAKRLNEAYIKYITAKIPFITLKVAMTLDGKIATPEGQSRWITGEEARRTVHLMRGSVDAILTAVGTVKADNPELTARIAGRALALARSPKRVVIDPDLEIPLNYKVFKLPPETIVATRKGQESRVESREMREEKIKALISKGVKIIEYEGERLYLKWLMKKLGEMEITSVMIEGGSSLSAYALQDGMVDKVVFFISPKIIGGKESMPAIGGTLYKRLQDAYRIHNINIKRVGEDLMIEGYIH